MGYATKVIPLDYERRNAALRALGFESYPHYLNSEMWQTIRSQVLARDDGRCVVCHRPASNVHHNSYEVDVLVGKDVRQLVSLCHRHHEEAEFDPRTGKRDLPAVREALASKGVNTPALIRQPTPRCLQPTKFDPMEGLSEKQRRKIAGRVKREQNRGGVGPSNWKRKWSPFDKKV